MTVTAEHSVTGLTCGHCAGSVAAEIRKLPGVSDVNVQVVAGGISTVTIASDSPVSHDALAAALDEAGDYRLVSD